MTEEAHTFKGRKETYTVLSRQVKVSQNLFVYGQLFLVDCDQKEVSPGLQIRSSCSRAVRPLGALRSDSRCCQYRLS